MLIRNLIGVCYLTALLFAGMLVTSHAQAHTPNSFIIISLSPVGERLC